MDYKAQQTHQNGKLSVLHTNDQNWLLGLVIRTPILDHKRTKRYIGDLSSKKLVQSQIV
jgi:hypothetical protein